MGALIGIFAVSLFALSVIGLILLLTVFNPFRSGH